MGRVIGCLSVRGLGLTLIEGGGRTMFLRFLRGYRPREVALEMLYELLGSYGVLELFLVSVHGGHSGHVLGAPLLTA